MEKRKWADILHIVSGKNQKEVQNPNGKYPIYGSGGKMGYADDYLCEPGTTIVGRKGTINRPIYVDEPFWNIDTAFGVTPGEGLDSKYLYYFCVHFNFTLLDKSTGRPSLAKSDLLKIEMPVPLIEEQRRIVSRIEEVFSELDNSVSTLRKTKEQLAVYRQAVLKEAFDSVKDVKNGTRIKDVCNDIKVGIVIKPTQYYVESGGVKAFRNANVRRNYVDDDNWALISKEGQEKNKKSIVHTDNVVIARSGANLGMAAVVPEKCDGFNAIDIVIAELNLNAADPHYLAYYVNSPYGLHVVNEYQHGGAQGHLNVKEFGLLPLILAPLSEQKNIVSEIESRLSVCDSIEHTVDTALLQAEAMRQSILKQAFEGRL